MAKHLFFLTGSSNDHQEIGGTLIGSGIAEFCDASTNFDWLLDHVKDIKADPTAKIAVLAGEKIRSLRQNRDLPASEIVRALYAVSPDIYTLIVAPNVVGLSSDFCARQNAEHILKVLPNRSGYSFAQHISRRIAEALRTFYARPADNRLAAQPRNRPSP